MNIDLRAVLDELRITYNPNRDRQYVECPLHDDRRPSLYVSLVKGWWKCYECGESGPPARLMAKALNMPIDRVLAKFEDEPGAVKPRPPLPPQTQRAPAPPTIALSQCSGAVAYFAKRKVLATAIRAQCRAAFSEYLGLGVMIPLFEWNAGLVRVGYQFRATGDVSKANRVRTYASGNNYVFVSRGDDAPIYVTEGPFDAMALTEVTGHTAVAVCSTTLNEKRAAAITGISTAVVLCPDNDDAGKSAVDRWLAAIGMAGGIVLGVEYPTTKDFSEDLQSTGSVLAIDVVKEYHSSAVAVMRTHKRLKRSLNKEANHGSGADS